MGKLVCRERTPFIGSGAGDVEGNDYRFGRKIVTRAGAPNPHLVKFLSIQFRLLYIFLFGKAFAYKIN